jgi:general stress protein YciG
MSAGITGTQTHTTNEKSPHSSSGGSNTTGQPHTQHSEGSELQPDRPPPPQGEAGEGKPKRPRGFAAMDRKLVSEIARKGGKAAHSAGTAHEFTSEEARVAGRKGGRATHAKRRKLVEEQTGKPESPAQEEKQSEP